MGKVCGPVDRIDIPAVFGLHLAARTFFAINAMAGKACAQTLHDESFAGAVGLGHQVGFALILGSFDPALTKAADKSPGFHRQSPRGWCSELEVHLSGKEVHAPVGSSEPW